MCGMIRRSDIGARTPCTWLLLLVTCALCIAPRTVRAQPAASPDAIQRQREDAERRRLQYLDQKRKTDHINERVRLYKELMASVPFELVPGTSNMVQVYVDDHDIRRVAQRIYFVADGSDEAGFASYYWPMVLFLNQAKEYDGGLPLYGRLDPQNPENNVAVFPNVRKQDFVAVVAQITGTDSAMALQLTTPVVAAYRKRLQEEVERLASRSGEVSLIEGPASMPAETRYVLFKNMPSEPREQYPPRRSVVQVASSAQLVSNDPVAVDRPIPLDPAPPAWSLRQGVNMLGPEYEGYNLKYEPDRLDLQPEVGPIAFMGGRDAAGNARTQPGVTLGLNQRFFDFLLVNESAFVVWSAGDAPAVNGVNLGAGLDFDILGVNLAGSVGITSLRVVGETATGLSFGGKLRFRTTQHLFVGALIRVSSIDKFRVEQRDASGNLINGRAGVTNASYAGIVFTLR
jgi:hypothetical protein